MSSNKSNRLSFGWRGLLLSTAGALISIAQANNAHANVAQYDVNWQGVPVGEATFTLERDDAQYRVSFDVRSTGMLAWMFPFESRGYSSGIIRDGVFIPTTHSAISTVRGEPRSWTVGFQLDGTVSHLEVQEDGEREPVPTNLQLAPDPLALALDALKDASPGASLAGQSFDGRRAVSLGMECATQNSSPERLQCQVAGELLAGASKRYRDDDDDDDDDDERPPIDVTLARDVIGQDWWPIELLVESRWGPVQATLVRPLVAAIP